MSTGRSSTCLEAPALRLASFACTRRFLGGIVGESARFWVTSFTPKNRSADRLVRRSSNSGFV
jgi:hypothetical protein